MTHRRHKTNDEYHKEPRRQRAAIRLHKKLTALEPGLSVRINGWRCARQEAGFQLTGPTDLKVLNVAEAARTLTLPHAEVISWGKKEVDAA